MSRQGGSVRTVGTLNVDGTTFNRQVIYDGRTGFEDKAIVCAKCGEDDFPDDGPCLAEHAKSHAPVEVRVLPQAFVDSPHRCTACGKRKVIELDEDLDGFPFERHVCLSCSPWTTREGE